MGLGVLNVVSKDFLNPSAPNTPNDITLDE
jgi:hypothetical protein